MEKPRLIYAESNSYDPYFNLTFEKYLFDNICENEVAFFLWQNEKTVVIGRNQNAYDECNITALMQLGGKVARRISGGGAVYHDLGNLNFTFISRGDVFNVSDQMDIIIKALDQFGIPAEKSGRNDITVLGKKFSGSAFYRHQDRSCHHGTIMINVDTLILDSVLNVSHEKLAANNVDSVRSRTVNLHDVSEDITVDSMKVALVDSFLHHYNAENFDEKLQIGGASVISGTGRTSWAAAGSMLTILKELSANQHIYSSEEWIYGKKIQFTNEIKNRFDWGGISICLDIKGGIITDAKVYSDSLLPDFISNFENALIGKSYLYSDMFNAIEDAAKEFGNEITPYVNDIKELIMKSI